jgi:hypothetical protein
MQESRQGEQLVTNWIETQQRLLTSWLDTVRNAGGATNSTLWNNTLDAWQRSIQQTLDTQVQWIDNWIQQLKTVEGIPPQMRAQIQQGEELFRRWTQAQRQLWQGWFEIVKQFSTTTGTGAGGQTGQQMVQAWQQMTTRMLETQKEWIQGWMSALTGPTTGTMMGGPARGSTTNDHEPQTPYMPPGTEH